MPKIQKVKSITYNWFQEGNTANGIGENYYSHTVGKNGVIDIIYHEPIGEGDKHFCDIHFENSYTRVFNLNSVEFELGGL